MPPALQDCDSSGEDLVRRLRSQIVIPQPHYAFSASHCWDETFKLS